MQLLSSENHQIITLPSYQQQQREGTDTLSSKHCWKHNNFII